MTDGPSAAKKAKTALPDCPYGSRCYRKNPQHLLEFNHPKDGVKVTKPKLPDSSSLPPCQYGAKCYRKNLMHFAEYSHPTSTGAPVADSGSDTDVMDSDEDDKKPAKKKDTKDILNRGMSLVKSFSQMTEAERKELIKKAFEAKQQLQKELEQTKQKVEEKEKALQKLQDQVNTGLLLVDGEKEALNGKKTVYIPLMAERAYKEGSAAQIHFRLAESQFYRLLGSYKSTTKLSKVEYVINPTLVKNFKEAREDLKKERGEDKSYPVLAFHGTQEKNISLICETGFKVPGAKGFAHRTDTGWYGKGVYFSEFPDYCMGYIQGAQKLLLCQVLPGKVFNCTKLIHGAALKSGYDSHTSPDKKELVIFNSHHILPSYIVHYKNDGGDFKYSKAKAGPSKVVDPPDSDSSFDDDSPTMQYLFAKATAAIPTSVFKGQNVLFSGSLSDAQHGMNALVLKHKGGRGTVGNMTLLVAAEAEFSGRSHKVQKAEKKGVPIVKEEFVYECILKKKFLDVEDYKHD